MNRQYIGARYVPKLFDNNGSNEWVSGVAYEPLTIVTYLNNSYTSKKSVPSNIGNPASNSEYWVNTGNYNGAITQLQNEVNDLDTRIDNIRMDSGTFRSMANRKFVFVGDSYTQVPTPSTSFVGVCVGILGLTSSQYHNIGVNGYDMNGYITEVNNYSFSDTSEITDVVVTGGINDAHSAFLDSTLGTTIPQLISAIRTKFPNAVIWAGFSGGGYYTNLYDEYSGFTYDNVQNIKFLWEENFSTSPYVIYMDKLDEWFRCIDDTDYFETGGSGLHPNEWGLTVLAEKVANYLKGGGSISPDLTTGNSQPMTSPLNPSLWVASDKINFERYGSIEYVRINGGGMNLSTPISLSTTATKIFTNDKTLGNGLAVMKPSTVGGVIFYATSDDSTLKPLLGFFTYVDEDVYLTTPTCVTPIENVNSIWYPTLEWILPANAV